MYKNTTRFALRGSLPGEDFIELSDREHESILASASPPKPVPQRCKNCRRLKGPGGTSMARDRFSSEISYFSLLMQSNLPPME